RTSARELRRQRQRFSGLFHPRREARHENHPPGPEVDLLSGRDRRGIRDGCLHGCVLFVSNSLSDSCANLRHPVLDLGSVPSRSRMEVAIAKLTASESSRYCPAACRKTISGAAMKRSRSLFAAMLAAAALIKIGDPLARDLATVDLTQWSPP